MTIQSGVKEGKRKISQRFRTCTVRPRSNSCRSNLRLGVTLDVTLRRKRLKPSLYR